VLFYVFFEAVLIPMFLIIGIWGGKIAGSTRRSSSSSTPCSARC
jgi:NADH:ubiquinone oxidoreductase subunit 4 (subunit M)